MIDNNKDLENIEEQFCARCEGEGSVIKVQTSGNLAYVPCPDCSGLGVKNTRTKQTNNEDR